MTKLDQAKPGHLQAGELKLDVTPERTQRAAASIRAANRLKKAAAQLPPALGWSTPKK